MFLSGQGHNGPKPELWVQPGGHGELVEFGIRLGFPDMFDRIFVVREYPEEEAFEVAGLQVTAVRLPHYTLRTYGFRVENASRTLAYSGDTAPSARLAHLASDVDLFVCEATLLRGELDGQPRGHLSIDEALEAYEASGARRLLLTHRPEELPLDDGLDFAYDGLELDV